jgi:LysR family transcriptional regulator, regulator for bpeEF and oprC
MRPAGGPNAIMDKLRAIRYFNLAVQTGSFAAAARTLEVSTPAITQLVAALEKSVGTPLLHRTTRGVRLTSDGARYHEVCRVLTNELDGIEKQLGSRSAQPRGSITVALFGTLGQYVVMPRIGQFLARYPQVDGFLKPLDAMEEVDRQDCDIAVMTGWPPARNFVVMPLGQSRNFVCASPAYWARYGKPAAPDDLQDHHCIVFRSSGGALLDRWSFERGGERRDITVKTRLVSDSSAWVDEAARAGVGVIRRAEVSARQFLAVTQLVPVLTDWLALDAPAHFAMFRPGLRRSRLVRAFLDFLRETYAELDMEQQEDFGQAAPRVPQPAWYGHTRGRQSAFALAVC